MSISDKLVTIAANEKKVYDKGYADGNGEWNSFWSNEGTRFTIPNNITSLKNGAFWGNQSLVKVDLPEGLTSIGQYAFNSCKELLLSSIPNGVTSIGQYAFEGCKKITVSVLPTGLTEIGYACFYDCGEMTVDSIPASVISVGQYAFCRCNKITTITFKVKPNSIAIGAFYNCPNLKTINVPWSEGEVANAPWGATNATINYEYEEPASLITFYHDCYADAEHVVHTCIAEEGMTWEEWFASDYYAEYLETCSTPLKESSGNVYETAFGNITVGGVVVRVTDYIIANHTYYVGG